MDRQRVQAIRPFRTFLGLFVSTIELYSEASECGQQNVISNAYTSYLTKLNQIIHTSSLYIFVGIMNKYLFDPLTNYVDMSDRSMLNNALADTIIDDMAYPLAKIIKDVFLRSHNRVSFEADTNDYYVYNFIHRYHAIIQDYHIDILQGSNLDKIKDPIKVVINGECIASLIADYRPNLVVICKDHINNIHTIIQINNYSYHYDTIQYMSYTIETYDNGCLTDKYILNITYPQ